MSDTRRLAIELHEIRQLALGHATNPQFGNSSVDGEGLSFRDGDGNEIGRIGGGENGMEVEYTYGPKPPMPSTPIVTADANLLLVQWDGLWADGNEDGAAAADPDLAVQAGLDRVEVHVSMEPTFVPDPVLSFAGVLPVTPEGGAHTVGPLAEAGDYYVVLMARGKDGQYSAPSQRVHVVTTVGLMENELFDLALRADEARESADGKNTVHYGEEPVAPDGGFSEGDLWFDTTEDPETGFRKNTPHLWDPSANGGEGGWVSAADSRTDAIQSAVDDLEGDLDVVRESADGKSRTFYRTTEPPAVESSEGDLWFDTSAEGGNMAHRFTDGVWVSVADQRVQTIQDAVDDFESELDDVRNTADGKNKTFYRTAEPSAAESSEGDLWFDTDDDNRLYRHDGSGWASAADGRFAAIQDAVDGFTSDLDTVRNTADGKNRTFYQSTMPATPPARAGDLWFNTANGMRLHRNNGATFIEVADGRIAEIEAEVENIDISGPLSEARTEWLADAAADAQTKAQNAADTAEAAAKLYADQIASGIEDVDLEGFKDYADDAAEQARQAAIDAAIAEARVIANAARDEALASALDADAVISQTVAQFESDLDLVRESADGKSRIVWSPNAASGDGKAGDTWFRTSSNRIIGYWRHSGSGWVSMSLDATVIPNLDAGKITSGFIDSERIKAGSIQAEKLMVGNFTNLVPDPSAQFDITDTWRRWGAESIGTAGAFWQYGTTISGNRGVRAGADGYFGSSRWLTSTPFQVRPGERYFIQVTSYNMDLVGGSPRFGLRLGDESNGYLGETPVTYMSNSGWETYTAIVEIPDNSDIKQAALRYTIPSTATSGYAYFIDPVVRPAVGGVMIEDGAIVADKISAEAVGATAIAAESIDASKIVAGGIQADSLIVPGTVGSTLIKDGAVTTDKIEAGAITAESGIIASLDAGVISSGFIDSARIRAGSISADKVMIGNTTNLIPDPGALGSIHDSWMGYGSGSVGDAGSGAFWRYASTSQGYRGVRVGNTEGAFGNAQWLASSKFQVKPGESYLIQVTAYRSELVGGFPRMGIRLGDIDDDYMGETETVIMDQGGFTTYSAIVTIPNDLLIKYGRLRYTIPSSITGTYGYFFSPVVRPAVGSTLIEGGAVTTEKIATGAITAESGVIGSLDAGKITVGEMDGARIKAASVRADQILVGGAGNLLTNPGFIGDGAGWGLGGYDPIITDSGGPTGEPVLSAQRSSGLFLYLGGLAQSAAGSFAPDLAAVEPGKRYVASVWVRAEVDIPVGNAGMGFRLRELGSADLGWALPSTATNSEVIPANTWAKVEGEFLVREDTGTWNRLAFGLRANGALNGERVEFSAPVLLPKVGATLIEDGAVTTRHIETGSITAESGIIGSLDAGKITVGELDGARIKAKSVQADSVIVDGSVGTTLIDGGAITTEKIAVGAITAESGIIGSLDAGVITTGELRGELIRAQSIAGESLAVDAIDGKTITGATVRTSSAGARVEMNSSGLFVKNLVGTNTVSMTSGSLTMIGGTITGGTIRTHTSGARVQLDTGGLKAWNPSNVETFSISANTGTVDMQGDLRQENDYGDMRFGPTLYGSSVEGNATPALVFRQSGQSNWGPAGFRLQGGTDSALILQSPYAQQYVGSELRLPRDTAGGQSTRIVRGDSSSSSRLNFERGGAAFLQSQADGDAGVWLRTYSGSRSHPQAFVSIENDGSAYMQAHVGSNQDAVAGRLAIEGGGTWLTAGAPNSATSSRNLTLRAYGSAYLYAYGTGNSPSLSSYIDVLQDGNIYLGGSRVTIASSQTYVNTLSNSSSAVPIGRINGRLYQVSSSRKYKILEEPIDARVDGFEDRLLSVEAKTWIDKGAAERLSDYKTAEGDNEDPVDEWESLGDLRRVPGLVAEDLDEAGLGMFVHYEDGEPEAVLYDRIGPALIPVVRRLRDRVNELERMMGEMANA